MMTLCSLYFLTLILYLLLFSKSDVFSQLQAIAALLHQKLRKHIENVLTDIISVFITNFIVHILTVASILFKLNILHNIHTSV